MAELRTSSNYVSIGRQELFLEVEYNSFVYSTNDMYFMKILNKENLTVNYLNFHEQLINIPRITSNNSFDHSVQQITDSNWLKFDFEKPIAHFERYNQNFKFFNVNSNYLSREVNVKYHTLKLHILTGFNFESLEGIILRCSYKDTKNNQVYVANVEYTKDYEVEYHSSPFIIGDRTFDRYIKVSIPSIESLYEVDSQLDITDEVKSLDKKLGLREFPNINQSKLEIEYFELNEIEVDSKGQEILKSVSLIGEKNGNFSTDIETEDVFGGVAVVIRENVDGDYFDLFPTFNGQLIEDYFAERSRYYDNSFIIFHDVELYEHIFDLSIDQGYSKEQTHKITHVQEANFNKSFKYRPIVENEDTMAFSIVYTIRILDETNNFYIIKKATYTYPDARKYGKSLNRLTVDIQNPIKVVNKILKSDNSFENQLADNPYLLSNSSDFYGGTIGSTGSIIPMQDYKIFLEGATYLVNQYVAANNVVETKTIDGEMTDFKLYTNDLIFGQGDLTIYLSEFDNFVRLTLHKLSGKNVIPYDGLNSNAGTKFNIVGITPDGEEIRIEQWQDEFLGSKQLMINELLFKVGKEQSRQLLESVLKVNLTILKMNGDEVVNETVLYTAKIKNINNFSYKDDYSVSKIFAEG